MNIKTDHRNGRGRTALGARYVVKLLANTSANLRGNELADEWAEEPPCRRVCRRLQPTDTRPTDLLSPHILRSLSHVKIVKIAAGCSADFSIAIDSGFPSDALTSLRDGACVRQRARTVEGQHLP